MPIWSSPHAIRFSPLTLTGGDESDEFEAGSFHCPGTGWLFVWKTANVAAGVILHARVEARIPGKEGLDALVLAESAELESHGSVAILYPSVSITISAPGGGLGGGEIFAVLYPLETGDDVVGRSGVMRQHVVLSIAGGGDETVAIPQGATAWYVSGATEQMNVEMEDSAGVVVEAMTLASSSTQDAVSGMQSTAWRQTVRAGSIVVDNDGVGAITTSLWFRYDFRAGYAA